jgi:hypothetical protein
MVVGGGAARSGMVIATGSTRTGALARRTTSDVTYREPGGVSRAGSAGSWGRVMPAAVGAA